MAAIAVLHANVGVTLALGLLIAVPTVVVAGPLFGKLAARWVPIQASSARLAVSGGQVATATAAGIVAPLAGGLSATHLTLLVLAIGACSLFFSQVNDAEFWLVKEHFGMTVGQTIKTWSVMETIVSVMSLAMVLLLSTFL